MLLRDENLAVPGHVFGGPLPEEGVVARVERASMPRRRRRVDRRVLTLIIIDVVELGYVRIVIEHIVVG